MFYTFFTIAKNARRKAIDHGSPKREPWLPFKNACQKKRSNRPDLGRALPWLQLDWAKATLLYNEWTTSSDWNHTWRFLEYVHSWLSDHFIQAKYARAIRMPRSLGICWIELVWCLLIDTRSMGVMFLCLMCFSCPLLVWTMGRRATTSPGGRSCCIGTAGFTAGRQIAVRAKGCMTPQMFADVRLHHLKICQCSLIEMNDTSFDTAVLQFAPWTIHVFLRTSSVDPRNGSDCNGLQRNSWRRRCRAYAMDQWIDGSPFVDLRPYQPPAGSAGSKPPPTSYNPMQVPGTSMVWIQGALLGFWFVMICDDLTWDLLMMYDVCPVLKIAWIGGPVIAPYTPAPGGPGVPRPPPFVPGGNLPGGDCNVETIDTVVSCMYFNLTYVAYAIIHDTYSFYFHDFHDFHRNIL